MRDAILSPMNGLSLLGVVYVGTLRGHCWRNAKIMMDDAESEGGVSGDGSSLLEAV